MFLSSCSLTIYWSHFPIFIFLPVLQWIWFAWEIQQSGKEKKAQYSTFSHMLTASWKKKKTPAFIFLLEAVLCFVFHTFWKWIKTRRLRGSDKASEQTPGWRCWALAPFVMSQMAASHNSAFYFYFYLLFFFFSTHCRVEKTKVKGGRCCLLTMAKWKCTFWDPRVPQALSLNVRELYYKLSCVVVSRCLREQERVWDPGHRLAADEDLP